MRMAQADWKNAAISYSNLSELQLSLGRIALASGRRRTLGGPADQSGDAFP